MSLTKIVGRLLLVSLAPYACPAGEAAVILGGSTSCPEWSAARRVGPANEFTSWVDGYLSGADRETPAKGKDFLFSVKSVTELHAWIDNFCAKNPRQDLRAAVEALVRDLQLQVR